MKVTGSAGASRKPNTWAVADGASEGRNFTYYDPATFRSLVADVGFDVIDADATETWVSLLGRAAPTE